MTLGVGMDAARLGKVTSFFKPSPPPSDIKFKRQDMSAVFKAALKTTDSIKPGLRFVVNSAISAAVKPFNASAAKPFEVKVANASYSLVHIWAKAYFGTALIGVTRNIVQKGFSKDNNPRVMTETKKLLNAIQQQQNQNISFPKEGICNYPTSTEGICAGYRFDFAEQYLNRKPGETALDVARRLEKGGTPRAAANQIVYHELQKNFNLADNLLYFIRELKNLDTIPPEDRSGARVNNLDSSVVGEALIILDQSIGNSFGNQQLTAVKNEFTRNPPSEFGALLQKIMDEERPKVGAGKPPHPFLTFEKPVKEQKIMGGIVVSDPIAFKEFMLKRIQSDLQGQLIKKPNDVNGVIRRHDGFVKALDWTVGLLQLKQAALHQEPNTQPLDRVTDPWIKNVFQSFADKSKDKVVYSAIAAARGLKLDISHTEHVMNESMFHSTDESFLRNASKLQDGLYALDLDTGDGAHAITMIIENGVATIVDPNGMVIVANTPKERPDLLRKLLAFYKAPNEPTLLALRGDKNVTNHNIAIFEIKNK